MEGIRWWPCSQGSGIVTAEEVAAVVQFRSLAMELLHVMGATKTNKQTNDMNDMEFLKQNTLTAMKKKSEQG